MSLLHPFVERRAKTLVNEAPAPIPVVPVEAPEFDSYDNVRVMPMDVGLGRVSQAAVAENGAQEYHDRFGVPMDDAKKRALELSVRLFRLGELAGDTLDKNVDVAWYAKNNYLTPMQELWEHNGVRGQEAAVTLGALETLALDARTSMEGQIAHAMVKNIGNVTVGQGGIYIPLDIPPPPKAAEAA